MGRPSPTNGERPAAALAQGKRFRLALAGIFLLALVLRVLHVWSLRDTVVFDLRLGDSQVYEDWARRIAGGDWVGRGVFWYAPLYPYFLGLLYRVFGESDWTPRLVQAALGAGSCVLLADAGRRLFSRTAGWLTGVALALYGPALFYDGLVHKPVLVLFLLSVVLWIVGARIDGPITPLAALGLGGTMALLVLSRENTLSLVPVLLVWLVLSRPSGGGRRGATLVAWFALGLFLGLFPVALRNGLVGEGFRLTAANFGDNFYKGNNERTDGTYVPLVELRGSPEFERLDARRIAERAAGRELTSSEVSRFWTKRALAYIRDQPLDWLALTARKALLVWNATELADSEDPYTYAGWSPVLRVTLPVLHLGVLAPLALLGLWVSWDRRRSLYPLYLMLAVYPSTVVLFYVFGRYRYPVVALVTLFAAAGVAGAPRWFRSASAGRRAACVVSVTAALFACNWPVTSRDELRSVTLYNIGGRLAGDPQRLPEAVSYYERALRLDPDSHAILYNLGGALQRMGQLAQAAQRYREALRIDPGFARARNNLGNALRAQGRLDAAMEAYRRALADDPELWEARSNLALVLAGRGRFEEAAAQLEAALRERPEDANLLYNLGNTYLQWGRAGDAVAAYERGLAVAPANPRIHGNLGLALAAQGRLDEAIERYREALRLDPDYGPARANLDAALGVRDGKPGTVRRPGPGPPGP